MTNTLKNSSYVVTTLACAKISWAIGLISNGQTVAVVVPITESVLPRDVNGDSKVNLLDVTAFIFGPQQSRLCPKADINLDGVNDLLDVAPFVSLLAVG